MPTTLIGQTSSEKPTTYAAPILRVKRLWADEWQMLGDRLEFVSAEGLTGSQGAGSLTFKHRYGNVKLPSGAVMATESLVDLVDWWVRMDLVGSGGDTTEWTGKIFSETRAIHSVPVSTPPVAADPPAGGVQTFVANGPGHVLSMKHVGRSDWVVDPDAGTTITTAKIKDLGWLPPMNGRDDRNQLVGNRSSQKTDGSDKPSSYLYGETNTWTNAQYIDYLLARFVDESLTPRGPEWHFSTGGEGAAVANLTDVIRWDTTQTIGEMLRKLIPRRMGLDYRIIEIGGPSNPGFAVQAFALSGRDWGFAGETVPMNPDLVTINTSQFPDVLAAEVVRTHAQQFDEINVIGERIVVCCSLYGLLASTSADLVPKWGDGLEADYKAGTGLADDEAEEHDDIRKSDRLDSVYQQFGAPVDWDLFGGTHAINLDDDGNLVFGGGADFQKVVRRTLSWLPIKTGVDYTVDPPVSANQDDVVPGLRRPTVWLWDEDKSRHFAAHKVGVGVSYSRNEWGVQLSASPNHLLALDIFDPAIHKTDHDPKYDYERMIATVAFRGDQRLRLKYRRSIPAGRPLGGVLNVYVPGAEFWYLASSTVVGVRDDGLTERSGGGTVLRNDADRLVLVMAGAIARFASERMRATIVLRGLWPIGGLLGQILDVVQQGNDTQFIESPITSITWQVTGAEPTTTIRAGYAGT